MQKAQIEVGKHYVAKVSDVLTIVRIQSENRYGGWNAVNIATGRMVRVKTAGRLRRPATKGEIERKQYGYKPEPTPPEKVPHLVNTAYREMAQMIIDLTDGQCAADILRTTNLPVKRCQEIVETRKKLVDILK